METTLIQGNFPELGNSPLEAMLKQRIALRTMSESDFIEKHASGTLRKAKRIGFAHKTLYLQERTAYEFGYGFEIKPKTHVLCGTPQVEGDCHAVTECGWHIERYQHMQLFPDDKMQSAYINVQSPGETAREGIGIIITQTCAPFVPPCHVIYALIAQYDLQSKQWHNAVNPF